MTNYEWIMKSGKMENFLFDVYSALTENTRGRYPLSIEQQYHGLSIKYGENICKKCVEWLQAEHKTKTYVALDDVSSIFNKSFCFHFDKNKYTQQEVVHILDDLFGGISTKLERLEVKEIDE